MSRLKKVFLLLLLAGLGWGGAARAATTASPVVQSLFDYDREVPVKVTLGRAETREGLTWTPVTFISVYDQPVTAWLVQDPAKPPRGLVLMQHGNSSSKNDPLLVYLAPRFVKELGYAAILTDAMYHGDRESPVIGKWSGQNLMGTPFALRDVFLQTVRDHRRVLDAALGELKLTGPVVYVGISLGTLMGVLTTAVDKRINRAIYIVGGADFLKISPMARAIKGFDSARQLVDPVLYSPLVKQPALLLNGKLDVFPQAASLELYKTLGSADKKQVWFDAGHSLPPEPAWKTIREWMLEKH